MEKTPYYKEWESKVKEYLPNETNIERIDPSSMCINSVQVVYTKDGKRWCEVIDEEKL